MRRRREPIITDKAGPLAALDAEAAMRRAVELAARGPATGANPRVGCVLTDAAGTIIGEGYHRGAGTAHAEVAALDDARSRGTQVQGAVAYVTLEPCAHTGRTGPCAVALSEAGVARVHYAVADPGDASAGGAALLSRSGVEVEFTPLDEAVALNRRWLQGVRQGRPYVIAKWAATLDGRTAARDGTSVWITGDQARNHTHHERASVDALVVGTGTVLADNPQLSARPQGVTDPHQPLRVVMGHRTSPQAAVWRDDNALHCDTHDPHAVLAALAAREVRTVMVEGGSTVTSAFVRAGLVDEIHAYIAPMLLGAGPSVISDVGIDTMGSALRSINVTVTPLGVDTLITALLTEGS